MKVLVLGGGPTGMGVACRAKKYLEEGRKLEVTVVETETEPGGLSRTVLDPAGYQWDYGGHVTFSNFQFYNDTLTECVPDWRTHQRICAIDMSSINDDRTTLLPYPLQKSIVNFPEEYRRRCATDLRQLYDAQKRQCSNGDGAGPRSFATFDEFCRKQFGETLNEVFFQPYNEKIWRTPMTELSAEWISARVAPVDERDLDRLEHPDKYANEPAVDHGWGPNATFRYPAEAGTGYIWKRVLATLPRQWFRFGTTVTSLDVGAKRAVLRHRDADGGQMAEETLDYDVLVSTMPVDILAEMCGYSGRTAQLRHTSVVVTGIGVRGQLPEFLRGKSWLYFPDDSPFYRVSVLSNYFPNSTPHPDEMYSLLVEQSLRSEHADRLDLETLKTATVGRLAHKGFLELSQVEHAYSFLIPYGYPIPTLQRSEILRETQQWLEQHHIYSRGRFGGWKYECSNQDYSFMQGAEVLEKIVENKPETVYTL